MEAAVEPKVRTYGNWRKPMSAGLGQLGLIGTGLMLVSLIIVILTVGFFGLLTAAVVGLILTVMLGTLVIHDRHGKTVLQRMAAWIGWRRTRSRGAHLYRGGPLGRNPWGTFHLPGLAARSTLSEARDSYDRPFALLHMPTTNHYTVVFGTEPDGAQLVDQSQIDVWVAHWGEWLASLADEPGLVAASVTIETSPDSGARLRREVLSRLDPAAPALAQEMLHEVVETYPAGSATVKAYVALTFSATSRAGGKRRDEHEVTRDLAARLPGLTAGLTGTGAGAARPLSAQQLCEAIRIAYEPRAAALIDESYDAGTVPELDWSDVGPSATEARWDTYRHDGATSVTWSMTAAPRGGHRPRHRCRAVVPVGVP
ncbi:MAG TPA: SCO6880 family protein, partial [Actinomycetota bacterium]|nr:SCO6880 family protein [Actinomycetota bacterium]